jgi:hypothetical protein
MFVVFLYSIIFVLSGLFFVSEVMSFCGKIFWFAVLFIGWYTYSTIHLCDYSDFVSIFDII